jgi:hypothetical protein
MFALIIGMSPVERKISQRYVPSIFVSVEPAELILLEGQPVYAPVARTSLLWVSNTEGELFSLGATGAFCDLNNRCGTPDSKPFGATSRICATHTDKNVVTYNMTDSRLRTLGIHQLTALPLGTTPTLGYTVGGRQSMVHMAALADGQPLTRARGHTRVVVSSMDHTVDRDPSPLEPKGQRV